MKVLELSVGGGYWFYGGEEMLLFMVGSDSLARTTLLLPRLSMVESWRPPSLRVATSTRTCKTMTH